MLRSALGSCASAFIGVAWLLSGSLADAEPVLCPGNLWYPGGVCPSAGPVASPPPLDPSREVYFESAETSGEVHLERDAGANLFGQNIAQVRLEAGDKIVTGPTGHAHLELTDGDVIDLNPNSEMTFEEVADWTEPLPFVVRFLLGFARFVHLPQPQCDVVDRCDKEGRVMVFSAAVGIRGTEFEIDAEPDGSGYMKLISGSLEITPDDGSEQFTMSPGDTVQFVNFALVR